VSTGAADPSALLGRLRGRIVLAGVGCRGRGDDALGPVLARRLAGVSRIHAIDCGDRLEDWVGDIARESPDTVLVVDAVDFGGRPGAIAVVEADSLARSVLDTHRATLATAMAYLRWRTGADVLLVGVQPSPVGHDGAIGPEVAATIDSLACLLSDLAFEAPAPVSEERP